MEETSQPSTGAGRQNVQDPFQIPQMSMLIDRIAREVAKLERDVADSTESRSVKQHLAASLNRHADTLSRLGQLLCALKQAPDIELVLSDVWGAKRLLSLLGPYQRFLKTMNVMFSSNPEEQANASECESESDSSEDSDSLRKKMQPTAPVPIINDSEGLIVLVEGKMDHMIQCMARVSVKVLVTNSKDAQASVGSLLEHLEMITSAEIEQRIEGKYEEAHRQYARGLNPPPGHGAIAGRGRGPSSNTEKPRIPRFPQPSSSIAQSAVQPSPPPIDHHGAASLRARLSSLIANEADIIDVFTVGIETESVGVVRMRNAVRDALVKLGKDIQGDDVYHHGRRMYAEGLRQNAAHIASMISMKAESTQAGHQRQDADRSESSYENDRHIKHMLQMRLGGGSNQAVSDIVKEVEDFILTCEQMKIFKGRLRAFIIQKETSKRTRQGIGKVSSLPEIVDRWFPKWLDLLWEPPIPSGAERIRWTCSCGKRLYDDYSGVQPEVLEHLKAMLRDPDLEPGTTPANHGRTSLPLHWPTSVASAIGSVLGHKTNASNTLPRPNRVGVPINPQDRDQREGRGRKRDLLFLLYCVPAGEGGCGTLLRQDLVPAVKTDREFFTFLRDVYYSSRRLSSRLSLRTVSAIGNCRIEVDFSKYASIHKHITSCPRDSRDRCQCWPPLDLLAKAYLYRTVTGETAKTFAMGPNHMAHSFQDPSHIDPLQRLVVRCIPMKMHTTLRAEPDDLGLGWGIYFEESWHFKTISIVLSILMLITSIVFGVTWSVVKSDIQGGFGVASYWATAATFILMVFGALATKQSF